MAEAGYIPIMAAVMIFVSLVFTFISIYFYLRHLEERRRMIGRITQSSEDAQTAVQQTCGATLDILQKVGKLVGGDKNADPKGTRLTFLKAGIRNEKVQVAFMGAKCLAAVLFPALFLISRMLFVDTTGARSSTLLLWSVCLMIAGYYIPDLWLRVKTSRRKKQIQNALPDALDLLVVCVEAGMGLDAAIHRVGEAIRPSYPALSDEFKLFNLEVRAGKAKRDALRNISLRTDLEDVNSLITLMIQAEKFGAGIARALRVYSDSFRTKRTQRAEEIAAKLPVKVLLPLVFFVFPSIFIVVLGPGAIRIYHSLIHTIPKITGR